MAETRGMARQLGSPAARHVHRVRRILPVIDRLAEHVIARAQRGACGDAIHSYADLQYHVGEVAAHRSSTAEGNYSGEDRRLVKVKFEYPRKVIAARRAMESCLLKKGIKL